MRVVHHLWSWRVCSMSVCARMSVCKPLSTPDVLGCLFERCSCQLSGCVYPWGCDGDGWTATTSYNDDLVYQQKKGGYTWSLYRYMASNGSHSRAPITVCAHGC